MLQVISVQHKKALAVGDSQVFAYNSVPSKMRFNSTAVFSLT